MLRCATRFYSYVLQMVGLAEKIEKLEKELKEKKSSDEASEFERAKREVREEAQKAEVNVDVLHEKLVTLENVARRTNNPSKEKMTMILSRFHAYKATPSFVAHLVLKLVSNKDEESILEKEQKLMKHFGLDLKTKKGTSQTIKEGSNEQQPSSNFFPGGWGLGGFSPGGFGPMQFNAQPNANAMPFAWPSFLPAMRPPASNRPKVVTTMQLRSVFDAGKLHTLLRIVL